jgi:hypothetical protein
MKNTLTALFIALGLFTAAAAQAADTTAPMTTEAAPMPAKAKHVKKVKAKKAHKVKKAKAAAM